MNTRVVLYPSLLVILALVGSDTFKAELLTNYEISPMQAHPGQHNLISVQNTGIVQADNVVVLITADSIIDDFSDVCAEGQIDMQDNWTLVAEFTRMSPYMQCGFVLEVSKPTSLNFTISADGRLGPWGSPLPWLLIMPGIALSLVAVEIVIVYTFVKKMLRHIWYDRKARFYKEKLEKAKSSKHMIHFVKETYGIKIGVVNAAVLELICCGNKEIHCLEKKSGLSRSQIMYRIEELRKHELLMEDMVEVKGTLAKNFKNYKSAQA